MTSVTIQSSSKLDATAPPSLQFVLSMLVLLIAGVFLFARLGHYALWDDEAITALTAQGVLRTGDTSAVLGQNIVAYRNGLLLRNMKDRATPPLQFYVVAPFLAAFGNTPLAARLPFAICGLACIALILWWMHRDEASTLVWILVSLGILGNVSLFLFFRQSRYYGLATLLTVAIAYSYLHNRSRAGLVGHAALSVLLLAANYMTFAAVSLAQAVDYVVWRRTRRRLSMIEWIVLLAPQVVIGAILISIWNPLRIADDGAKPASWLGWKLTLIWWNLRDLNACEFGAGVLLLAAPIAAIFARSSWLWRSVVAFVVCIVVITLVSPQAPSDTKRADVRYLAFMIPLCVAIGALTLAQVARVAWPIAICIAIVAFNSNLLHGTWLREPHEKRSTVLKFARELRHPLPEPFTPTAAWINANVKSGETIAVLPRHMTYPLMLLAPGAIYAGQIDDPPPKDLESLPPVHRVGRTWPDYFVLFAPEFHRITLTAENYDLAVTIPVFGLDIYRPELFWRQFEPVGTFSQANQVFILRKRAPKIDFGL